MRRRDDPDEGRASEAETEAGTAGQGRPPPLPVAALRHLAAAAQEAGHGLRAGQALQQGVHHRCVGFHFTIFCDFILLRGWMIDELLRDCKFEENLLVPVVLSIVCVFSSAVFIRFLHSFGNEFGITMHIHN
jgi:hypothetical protein